MNRPHPNVIPREKEPTPSLHKEVWAVFTVLCFLFSVIIFRGQSALLQAGFALEGLSALYSLAQPFFGPFFRLLKLASLSALTFFPLAIFTVLQIIGLHFLVPALQEKMQQIAALERALGPVTKPIHRIWFGIALLMSACALSLTTLPAWKGDTAAMTVLYSLLRIGLFTTCAATALGTTLIGYRLSNSWKRFQRFGAGLKTRPNADPVEAASGGKSDTPPGGDAIRIEKGGLAAANSDESVFIALAAELVESAGRTRQLPNYRQLEMPLLELQQAAAATHTGQFEHANLRGLCEQACELLAAGKLNSLPDLNAARTAYQKHDPSLYIDLATELRQKIKA
jgi:hypothetical protein